MKLDKTNRKSLRGDDWAIIEGVKYVKVHTGESFPCPLCDLNTMQKGTCLDVDLGCDGDIVYLREDKFTR